MRCQREGCGKPASNTHIHCRMLCRLVDEELTAIQNVCEYFADSGEVDTALLGPVYAAVVALADALTDLDNLDYRVLRAAQDTGLSPREYRAVKLGH